MTARPPSWRVGQALLVVLGAAVAGGCAVDDPDRPTPLDELHHTAVIEPGAMLELNLIFDAGAAIDARFESRPGPLEWNVHTHRTDIEIFDQGLDAARSLRVEAARDEIVSLYWENGSTVAITLDVEVEATAGVALHSWTE